VLPNGPALQVFLEAQPTPAACTYTNEEGSYGKTSEDPKFFTAFVKAAPSNELTGNCR